MIGAARRGEVGLRLDELVADDAHQADARAQDVEIVGDFDRQPVERLGDLVASERGQARKAQFEDRARLRFREADRAVGVERVARIGDQRDERRHVARRPHPLHQRGARGRRIGRGADEADHLVDIGDRDGEADLDMRVVARLGQQIFGPPRDDFLAEVEERAQHVGQRQHLRPAAVQRDHVGAETRLQGGEAPELIEHHVCDRVALDLDDDAHAVAIGLVAQVGDALDALLANEFRDALDQRRLVDLIGDLVDDQRLAILAQLFDRDLGAHDDRAAAGRVGGADARSPEDGAAGREVGSRNMLQQFFERDVGLVHEGEKAVDHLAEIVRRDVGRHADRDAACAVDEQIGKARRQDDRLGFLLVVVRLEVDGVLVEVLEQRQRDGRKARLGVALRRRRIAIDRAEIALPVDQRRAHREVLRHAHQGVVDRKLAVRMILADHVADGARRLVVGAVGREIQLAHRVEDAPMHGLQAVANVGQSAAHDHAHRVIEITAFHFIEDRDGFDISRSARGGPLVNNVGQWEEVLDANRAVRL